MASLLRVEALCAELTVGEELMPVLRDVSFDLAAGTTLALVGESGSGKSMTALAIMGLLPEGIARATAGQVVLDGQPLIGASAAAMRKLRGNAMSMIFQEPMTSLNPVMTVGAQIVEVLQEHRGLGRARARSRAIALLERVHIADAARRIDEYPHRLSGGMRQRVMIAMALACEPAVLIADEPTTALDVTIQAQILGLLAELQENSGTAIILITHNLGVVAQVADEVAVMYAGAIVEQAPVGRFFADPKHPYSVGLLRATPDIDNESEGESGRLMEIPGTVPPLRALPSGCAFAPRCDRVIARCREECPVLTALGDGRRVACHVALAGQAA